MPVSDARHAESSPSVNAAASPTILIVAREPTVRSVTRRILERRRFRTLEACDDREAIAVFRENASEIQGVVVDLGMPGAGAESVARECRRSHPTLPILFTGGYSEGSSSIRVMPDPTTDFLAKPFGLDALAEKAEGLFGGSLSEAALADHLG
jgi:DNA-binding NtrC family response regulator